MNKIIVITGPTGVGKTKLSISLAKMLNAEIINADSMQVYKDLNIGTAKIKENEKENIPHHLFDIKNIDEAYSIYDYQIDARMKIDEIRLKNKNVIFVGGTGLYIKSALYDYKFSKEVNENDYSIFSTEELYKKLLEFDPDTVIDKNNRRRLIRAINYYKENNCLISENKTNCLLYDTVFIGLTTSRDKLYDIINKRVDLMIDEGLIEEARYFYDRKIYTKPLISGIGYKELYRYFANEITLIDAIDLIKKNSRHYAKRQYTFFNNQMNVKWFDVDFDNFNNTISEVYEYTRKMNK